MGQDLPHSFFKLGPGKHDEMAAATAFDAEIHAYPQHIPFVGAAGVGFLHTDDVTDPIFFLFIPHENHLLSK